MAFGRGFNSPRLHFNALPLSPSPEMGVAAFLVFWNRAPGRIQGRPQGPPPTMGMIAGADTGGGRMGRAWNRASG